MTSAFRRALWLPATILLVAACATPQPPAPAVDSNKIWQTAQLALAQGRARYEAGHFEAASMWLDEALSLKLPSPAETVQAHKLSAFIACSRGDSERCRAHFRALLEIEPGFELARAEAGHPMWGPVFSDEKAALAR